MFGVSKSNFSRSKKVFLFIVLGALGLYLLSLGFSLNLITPWAEYRDETLGISFQYPSDWPKPKSYYLVDNTYNLNVGGVLPYYNTFSKPEENDVRKFPENDYTKEQININGIDFTFYRKKLLGIERFVGTFVSQNPPLELDVNTLTYDFYIWDQKRHDQIVRRLIFSIKPI